MKTYQWILLVFFLISLSCQKDDGQKDDQLAVLAKLKSENGLTYHESLSKWNGLKNKNGNSYIYQTTFISWTGFGNTTELKIVDGAVTSRTYQAFKTNKTNGQKEIVDSYFETQDKLGSHESGAAVMTIDELYDTCVKDYLVVDEENNTLYFETEKDGLMTLCGFVPKNCADDCFSGVSISSFEWLK